MDAGALITAVTGLLIAVGSGIAWLVQRRDKARPAISRQVAEVSQASDAMGGALTIVQASLTADLERVRKDAEADRARAAAGREADRARIACLERRTEELRRDIENVRSAWGAWYRDLVDRWHEHRTHDDPPAPPASHRDD